MEVRLVAPADIPTYQAWREHWGWQQADLECLPQNGIMVHEAGNPLVMGFIYRTDSKVGFLTGILANPEVSPLKRGKALLFFGKAATGGARELGLKELIGWTENASVARVNQVEGAEPIQMAQIWRKDLR